MRNWIGLFLVSIMILTVFLTGCSSDKQVVQSKQANKDNFTVVSAIASESLNPVSGVTTDKMVMHQIFDTLVKFNPDYSISPNLAESWTESDDKMSVTFKLRQDVTFHDGSKLTANDILFSYDALMKTPNGAFYKSYIPKLEMIGNYTIKITKGAPFVNIFNVLAETPYIVPKSVYEADGKNFEEHPVGSGAYKFIQKNSDGSVTMEANDKYLLGSPTIKKITVKPPMDYSTSIVALENGDVDMVQNVPSNLFKQIEENPQLKISAETGWSQRMMVFPGEPFASNVKLREAIYHGINPENVFAMGANKDGIIAKDLFGQKIMGNYNGLIDIGNRYNPELAKKLLKESGYDVSKPITLDADPTTAGVLQVIQGDLKAIGLNIKIQQVDSNTLFNKLLKGKLPGMVADFGTNVQTLEDMLSFYSTQGDTNKMFGEKDPNFDVLMEKIKMEKDADVRAARIKQAYENLANRFVVVPFYETNFNIVHNSSIENVHGMATYVTYVGDLKIK